MLCPYIYVPVSCATSPSIHKSNLLKKHTLEAVMSMPAEVFYPVGVITCKPTARQAEEYYQHCIVDHADWSAVDSILAMKDISPQTVPMEEFLTKRSQYAQGMGGLPIVGDPDHVARQLIDLSQRRH